MKEDNCNMLCFEVEPISDISTNYSIEQFVFGIKIPIGREDNGGVSHERREKMKYTKSAKPRIHWMAKM